MPYEAKQKKIKKRQKESSLCVAVIWVPNSLFLVTTKVVFAISWEQRSGCPSRDRKSKHRRKKRESQREVIIVFGDRGQARRETSLREKRKVGDRRMKEKVRLLCFAIKSGGFRSDICDPSPRDRRLEPPPSLAPLPPPASIVTFLLTAWCPRDLSFLPVPLFFLIAFSIILSTWIKLTRKDSPKMRSYQNWVFFNVWLRRSTSCTSFCLTILLMFGLFEKNENGAERLRESKFKSLTLHLSLADLCF